MHHCAQEERGFNLAMSMDRVRTWLSVSIKKASGRAVSMHDGPQPFGFH